MKTSVSDMIRTEKFLQGKLAPDEKVLFEARLLVDADLKENTFFHRLVHRLVSLYHREKLRREVEAVHQRLFHHPDKAEFRQSILELFNS